MRLCRVGTIAVTLAAVGIGVLIFFAAVPNSIRERLTGETPQAKIEAYLQAILDRDRSAALSSWEALPADPDAILSQRREQTTDELLSIGMTGFTIFEPQWWTTCCEPRVICEPRNAGGARVQVQVLDDKGFPSSYTFDVFVREQPYWGDAMGNPPRQWVIRDIYASDQEPLFWRLVYEPNVRHLE